MKKKYFLFLIAIPLLIYSMEPSQTTQKEEKSESAVIKEFSGFIDQAQSLINQIRTQAGNRCLLRALSLLSPEERQKFIDQARAIQDQNDQLFKEYKQYELRTLPFNTQVNYMVTPILRWHEFPR
jgi:hypothetical protein